MVQRFVLNRRSSIKRWRTSVIQIATHSLLLIAVALLSVDESTASYDYYPSRERSTCRCDSTSIASVLWGYCLECICIGAHCYYTGLTRNELWKRHGGKFGTVNFHSIRDIPRGGETSAMEEKLLHDESDEKHIDGEKRKDSTKAQDLSVQPLIDTETVSLALKLTCETNRRVHHGTSPAVDSKSTTTKSKDATKTDFMSSSSSPQDKQQLMHHSPVHVNMPQQSSYTVGHPIESAAKQIKVISNLERAEETRKEEFTIFHATKPLRDGKDMGRRGVLRWGPDLKSYTDTMLSEVGLSDENDVNRDATSSTISIQRRKQPTSPLEDERQLILSLTVIYLDRATSVDNLHVDPNTGKPWYPSCPYVVPQTVHRLVLTAMIVATKSIRGEADNISNTLREAANSLLQNSGDSNSQISEQDVQQMEQWMMNALGGAMQTHHYQHHHHYGNNWHIPPDEIGQFIRKWGETFYPKRVAAHDERNRSRMERLERFWRDQTSNVFGSHGHGGTDHGHGNHGGGWDGQPMGYHYPSNNYESIQHDGSHYQRVDYDTSYGQQQ